MVSFFPQKAQAQEQPLTCDWSLNFNHGFLRPQKGSTLVNNLQGGIFINPSFKNEMLLQDIRPRLIGSGIKNVLNSQLGGWWKGYTCERKDKDILQSTIRRFVFYFDGTVVKPNLPTRSHPWVFFKHKIQIMFDKKRGFNYIRVIEHWTTTTTNSGFQLCFEWRHRIFFPFWTYYRGHQARKRPGSFLIIAHGNFSEKNVVKLPFPR